MMMISMSAPFRPLAAMEQPASTLRDRTSVSVLKAMKEEIVLSTLMTVLLVSVFF